MPTRRPNNKKTHLAHRCKDTWTQSYKTHGHAITTTVLPKHEVHKLAQKATRTHTCISIDLRMPKYATVDTTRETNESNPNESYSVAYGIMVAKKQCGEPPTLGEKLSAQGAELFGEGVDPIRHRPIRQSRQISLAQAHKFAEFATDKSPEAHRVGLRVGRADEDAFKKEGRTTLPTNKADGV